MYITFKTVLMTFLLTAVFGATRNRRIKMANETLRNLRPSWCNFTIQMRKWNYTALYNCSDIYYSNQVNSNLRLSSLQTVMENVRASRGSVCLLQRRMLNDFSDSSQCCKDGPVADKIQSLELKLLQLWKTLKKKADDPIRNIECTPDVSIDNMPERVNEVLHNVKILLNSLVVYSGNFNQSM